MKKTLPVLIIAVVLLVALGGGALLMRSPSSDVKPAASAATNAAPNAPRPARAAVADDSPPARVRGRADAPVKLEEFSDFQCPTCGLMHGVLKQLVAKYPTQVGVAFRNFPLREIHRHAAEAALAAEAAGMQGKFWEMHDLIYEKQNEWKDAADARALFRGYAQSLGLDVNRFAADMEGSVVAMRIVADERRGAALGIHGTPTFFINGRELTFDQSNTLEKLSAA
ncbi:MAG: DsbA family protein, partial [Pyrinomonadaceae bacterium]